MKLHISKWPAKLNDAGDLLPAIWHVMVEVEPGHFINKQVAWTEEYDPEGMMVIDIGDEVHVRWDAGLDDADTVKH